MNLKNINFIAMNGKLAIEKLQLILPNILEWIVDLEKDKWNILEEIKKMEICSCSIEILRKKKQYQLLIRFVRVVISKVEKSLEKIWKKSWFWRNEEQEYDLFRKKYAKSMLRNRGVKKELVYRTKKFIEGKSLNSRKLFKTFGLE